MKTYTVYVYREFTERGISYYGYTTQLQCMTGAILLQQAATREEAIADAIKRVKAIDDELMNEPIVVLIWDTLREAEAKKGTFKGPYADMLEHYNGGEITGIESVLHRIYTDNWERQT